MGTCQVTLNFTPGATGARSATLTVSATTGGSAPATLSGTGIPPGALSINPLNQNFGSQLVNTQSSESTFTVQNTGGAATGVPNVSLTGSAAGQYIISTNNCMAALASNGTCTVGVKFAPTMTSSQPAFLTVSANPGGSVQASLSGTGLAPASLGINPGSWTAPDTVIGQSATKTFAVTNNGDVSTTVVTASVGNLMGFSILSDTCSGQTLPGRTGCNVQIQFSPGSAGGKGDTLTVSAATGGSAQATLSGNGITAAMLTLAPDAASSVNFGTLVVGQSADETYVLTNTGQQSSGAVTAALADTTNYSFLSGLGTDCTAAQVLAPGASCNVRVHFAPTTGGTKPCALTTVNGGPGGTPSLSLTGIAQTPANLTLAAASGSSVNFGTVIIGNTQDETFVLSNTGQQTSGALTFSITDSTNYSILTGMAGDCSSGGALAGAATCNLRVHFAPMTAGAKPNTLAVANTGAGGAPMLGLTGTGQMPASVSLAAGTGFSANFGTVLTTSSQDETFVLTNNGGASTGAMTWALSDTVNYSLLGGQSGDCSMSQTLAPAMSCNIRVHFAPASAGTKNCNLTTANSGAGGAPVLALIGVGQTPAALTLSPGAGSSANFGNVVIGASQTETFVLTNTGTQTSGTLSYSLMGTDASLFSILSGMAGDCSNITALAGLANCNLRVQFTPLASAGHGSKSAILLASANPGGSQNLALSGNAQNPAQLTSLQTGNNFMNVEVGVQSSPFTWTISNSGDVPTGTISLSNSNPTEVITTADMCNGQVLAAGAQCTVQVMLKPSSFGGRSGVLTYSASPGSSVQFTATGTGMWRLTVTVSGGNSSTNVTSADGQITCPNFGCTGLYANNASITLTSHNTNGSGVHFKSWSAPSNCAASGNGSVCTFNITASTATTLTYSAIQANMTFVSSLTYAANLGTGGLGLTASDNACNNLANTAGINNTAGNAYMAWMSSSVSSIGARFPVGVGSLLRMDDVPFAMSGGDLIGGTPPNDHVRVPNNLDENGKRVVGDAIAFTGSDSGGVYRSGTCSDWTSNSSTFSTNVGRVQAGSGIWVFGYGGSNCPGTAHIYCMGKASTAVVAAPTVPGGSKIIYWTSSPWLPSGGWSGAQTYCNAHKPSAYSGVSFNPLLATTTIKPVSSIDLNATYYQPNGVRVGTGYDLQNGAVYDGIFTNELSTYLGGEISNWTGTNDVSALGISGFTCSDWTSSANTFNGYGSETLVWFNWFGQHATNTCNVSHPIYCIQP
jgi:hypothetical protein